MDFRDNALHDLKNRDEEFRAFIASIERTSHPTLWFAHSLLPHHPWRYLPSGSEYARATLIPGLTGDRWGPDSVLAAQAQQRHLLQAGFVDRLLGELLQRLRATGLYDRSVIVVTADHGVSFRPNGERRRLTGENVAEVGLVPLLVKSPGQRRGRVVDTVIPTSAVLPLIADALAIPVPWKVDRVLTAAPSGFEQKLTAALDRQTALFASGLYRVGPDLELVGRPVADLDPAGDAGLRVRLTEPELFENVGSTSLSPAHVVGVLAGDGTGPGLDVAVAVNGTIAATARTFSFAGAVRFEAMVPEDAFRSGRNDVDVLVVSPSGELLTTRGRP